MVLMRSSWFFPSKYCQLIALHPRRACIDCLRECFLDCLSELGHDGWRKFTPHKARAVNDCCNSMSLREFAQMRQGKSGRSGSKTAARIWMADYMQINTMLSFLTPAVRESSSIGSSCWGLIQFKSLWCFEDYIFEWKNPELDNDGCGLTDCYHPDSCRHFLRSDWQSEQPVVQTISFSRTYLFIVGNRDRHCGVSFWRSSHQLKRKSKKSTGKAAFVLLKA